jgi:hypothetical protein
VRRAAVCLALVPFVVALAAPKYWEVGLRLSIGALGGLAAWALSRRVWTVMAVPRELVPLRIVEAASTWPAAAATVRLSLENALPRAAPDRVDRARGLRRTCRAIAAQRLHDHRGLDLDRDAAAARALLGGEVHDFLEGGPMIDHERLVRALERL